MNEKEKIDLDFVECVDEYNKEGYLVKRKLNGVPIFIPKEMTPRVQIVNHDTEWVIEKTLMTIEEFNKTFPHLSTQPSQGGVM